MIDVKRANVCFLDGKYREAAEMYREGAEDGNAECAFNYAYCLYKGIGVAENKEEAKSYFVFSSSRIPEASYNLAVMYLHGNGVKRDYRRAYEYMSDAAESGILEAQLYLAVAHTMGEMFLPDVVFISLIPFHTPEYLDSMPMLDGFVEESAEEADWRIRAARQDNATAFYWFKRAAMHPSDYVEDMAVKSKFLYARCFLDGLGTDFNRDRGNALMLVAAKEGSGEALSYLMTDAPYMLEGLENKELLAKIRKLERLG